MAESALKDLSVDSSVRVLEKLREKWVRDQVTDIKYATQKGHEKGIQKGRQEGRQEVALNLLSAGLTLDTVSKYTGLSEEEIKKLKNDS